MKKIMIMILSILLLTAIIAGCAKQEEPKEIPAPAPAPTKTVTAAPEPKPVTTTTTKTTTATTPAATDTMTLEEEEVKAEDTAKLFVKSLDGYKNQNGRELQIQSSVKSGCTGCWIVELKFSRDMQYFPEKEEIIKVRVQLKNWKMDSYTFG